MLVDEIIRQNNLLETAAESYKQEMSEKEKEKILKERTKEKFYNIFLKNGYIEAQKYCLSLTNREKIISEIAENQEEIYIINDLFEKCYKQIERIFKNDYQIQLQNKEIPLFDPAFDELCKMAFKGQKRKINNKGFLYFVLGLLCK